MNVDVLDPTQEHIQEDLQSMQESLEGLKSSLENDATLASKQEFVSLMKDIVLDMSKVDNNQNILDLYKELEDSNTVSSAMLEGILSSFVSLKLAYADASANHSLEKYEQITHKKSELDKLLSDLQTVDSYQIDPNTPVVEPDQAPLEVDDTSWSDIKEEDWWLLRNTKAIFSKEEWEKDWKMNTVRSVSGLALVWGAVWWAKKLLGWMSWDKKEKSSSSDKKEGMSRWKKWLIALGITGVGVWVWKYWDKIKELLGFGEKLSFEDSLKKVEGELNNISEWHINTWRGSISYDDSTESITSYGRTSTKIDKSEKKIPWLDTEFSDYEQLIFTANFVNYLKYHHKWRSRVDNPFFKWNDGDIYMKIWENGKERDLNVISGGIWSTLAKYAPDIDWGFFKKALSIFWASDNNGKDKLIIYLNKMNDVWKLWDASNQENPDNDPIIDSANRVHDDIRDTIHHLQQNGNNRLTITANKIPNEDAYIIWSRDKSTRLELLSWWKYRVDSLDIIFATAEEAIRVANFTNKMKKEHQHQWRNAEPFTYEREYLGWPGIYINSKNSENFTSNKMRVLTKSSFKETMPTIYEGNIESLLHYLNSIKDDNGSSRWL